MTTRAPALPAEERRAAIIAATLPLLIERGPNLSTREIAEAAGIAEGTIFGVFPDKESFLQAALLAAFDPEPTERAIEAIDRSISFEAQLEAAVCILQRRMVNIWRLVTSVGPSEAKPTQPHDSAALARIFDAEKGILRTDSVGAARRLRALTLAVTHPVLFAGPPMTPQEIVMLLLNGIRTTGDGQTKADTRKDNRRC